MLTPAHFMSVYRIPVIVLRLQQIECLLVCPEPRKIMILVQMQTGMEKRKLFLSPTEIICK